MKKNLKINILQLIDFKKKEINDKTLCFTENIIN